MGAFQAAGNNLVGKMMSGLDAFADIIMADSLEQCPIETGTLRRSARVGALTPVLSISGKNYMLRGAGGRFSGASKASGDGEVILGYGFGDEINPKTRRPASEYAVPVHEILDAYHAPPTKAKFLEDPVFSHAAMMEPYLAASMKDDVGFSRVMAQIGGDAAMAAEQAGGDVGDLDAGDHPKGTPHD